MQNKAKKKIDFSRENSSILYNYADSGLETSIIQINKIFLYLKTMKPNNLKKLVFIFDYIWGPIVILIMFWTFFFDGNSFSIQKIMDHKYDPKLYIALTLAILFWVFLRRGMKFPKDNKE